MVIQRFPFDRHNCRITLTVPTDRNSIILYATHSKILEQWPDGFRARVPSNGVLTSTVPEYKSPVHIEQPLLEFKVEFERDPIFVINAHVMVGWLLVMLAMCSFCETRRPGLVGMHAPRAVTVQPQQ
jgi:hypothetical protein